MAMAGKSSFFDSPEYQFPKPLVEIRGKTMVQWAIENYQSIQEPIRFIFVVRSADCSRFHLDNILKLLTQDQAVIVRLDKETRGAACSALMAVDCIQNDSPLIIANSDQVIEEDLNGILKNFRERDLDAGVICFETVHPRWSYVRLDENDHVIEAAEKRPLSRHAVAGFYYFKKGSDFVRAAMKSIEKDAQVDGSYYVAPTLNELILENRKLGIYQIQEAKYHTLYSPQKIKEFEDNR